MQIVHGRVFPHESDRVMSGDMGDEALPHSEVDAAENLRAFLRILREWEADSRSERARKLVESAATEE